MSHRGDLWGFMEVSPKGPLHHCQSQVCRHLGAWAIKFPAGDGGWDVPVRRGNHAVQVPIPTGYVGVCGWVCGLYTCSGCAREHAYVWVSWECGRGHSGDWATMQKGTHYSSSLQKQQSPGCFQENVSHHLLQKLKALGMSRCEHLWAEHSGMDKVWPMARQAGSWLAHLFPRV